MPKNQQNNMCIEYLRYNEYYNMQDTFDDLYLKSKNNEVFTNLYDLIFSKPNVLLAYRNLKTENSSYIPGIDDLTIKDISVLSIDDIMSKIDYIISGSSHAYRPKPTKEIVLTKPNGQQKSLGISCIWDRLIQQCIKQVIDPICEAKFSNNSFGSRRNRCVENAISKTYRFLQLSHLYYVIQFDILDFLNKVNHSKLLRQIWTIGIQDKRILYLIKCILKGNIKRPNNTITTPLLGIIQCGLLSPILCNIVLNELDHWIESQWENHPIIYKYALGINKSGSLIKSAGYNVMKRTKMKQMFFVRYNEDFRVFCSTFEEAKRTKLAIEMWIQERLKIDVSNHNNKIINTKKNRMEFLGFEIKVFTKRKNHDSVVSHICNTKLLDISNTLKQQIKRISCSKSDRDIEVQIEKYNAIVTGIHSYFKIATNVNLDLQRIQWDIMIILNNRLNKKGICVKKSGRLLTEFEKKHYGKSKMLRFINNIPIYPIGYIQHKNPLGKRYKVCCYTKDGRSLIHEHLKFTNLRILYNLLQQPIYNRNIEYFDNKIALFYSQFGKCAITGILFEQSNEIHCHHIIPKHLNGTDDYRNLILVLKPIHELIHATNRDIIKKYINLYNLDSEMIQKINKLREYCKLKNISLVD